MKFQKSTVLPHLQRCALVARDKSPSQWVRLVRLTVTDSLQLCATNYTVTALGTVAVTEPKPLDVAVDCSELLDSVQRLGETFKVELKSEVLHLTAGERKYRIACHPVDAYPAIEAPPEKPQFVLPSAALVALIGRVQHAMDRDTTSARNGVTLESTRGKLTARATDGREAAWAETACDVDLGEPRPIPSPLVPLLLSLAESAQSIGMSFAAGQLALSAESSTVLMRPLGHPPIVDLGKAIGMATQDAPSTEVQRDEMLEAVRCVNGTGALHGDIHHVELELDHDTLRLFTRGGKREASDVVKCSGDAKATRSIDGALLADCLKPAGECVELAFSNQGHLVIRCEGYAALVAGVVG
jgi:hypothetical protein